MPERALGQLSNLLTKSLLSGDFEQYRQLMALPVSFSPREGKPYVLTTVEELKADFDLYVEVIRLHGVTDLYRKLLSISFTAEGAVARWLTHILVRATLLTLPFETRMRCVHGADGWRIAELESSEGHLKWTMGAGSITGGQFT